MEFNVLLNTKKFSCPTPKCESLNAKPCFVFTWFGFVAHTILGTVVQYTKPCFRARLGIEQQFLVTNWGRGTEDYNNLKTKWWHQTSRLISKPVWEWFVWVKM